MDRVGEAEPTDRRSSGAAVEEPHHLRIARVDSRADAAPYRRCRHVRAASRAQDVCEAHPPRRDGDRSRSRAFDVLGTAGRVQPSGARFREEALKLSTTEDTEAPMKKTLAVMVSVVVLALSPAANAAEIKVFCTNGVKAVVEELIPRFEQTSGDKVVLQFEPSTQLRKRIDAGEPFDLV